MDKFDTADDKVISESDSSMNADNKKASFCSLSKTNAISNQKAKNDEDNNLLVDSYKLKMIRELKTRVNIHRFLYFFAQKKAALRLALARNDDSFRYVIDRNENRFKMNLKEVALSVIRVIRNKDDDDDYDYIQYHDYLYEDSVEDKVKDDKV